MNLGCLIGIGVKKECFSSYLTELKLSKFLIFGPLIKHITKFKFLNLARKVYLMLLKKKLPTGTCSGKFILTKNSARNLHYQNPIITNINLYLYLFRRWSHLTDWLPGYKKLIFVATKMIVSILILIYFGTSLVACINGIPFCRKRLKELREDENDWSNRCLNGEG
jgi:hypothetical protein